MKAKIMGLAKALKALTIIMVAKTVTKVCVFAFVQMYKRAWTGVPSLVTMEIRRQVHGNIRYWLTRNGVRHCDACLGTRLTLYKQEGETFLCEQHGGKAHKLDLIKP